MTEAKSTNKKIIRRADVILAAILVILGLALSFVMSANEVVGAKLVVLQDGKEYGSYSLLEDQEITVDSPRKGSSSDAGGAEGSKAFTNTFTIKDGTVTMTHSNCKNQVCVETAPISKSGETIICLPHKLVLKIDGASDVDTIAE